LSTDRTSLVNAQDRAGVVMELKIADSGDVVSHGCLFRAAAQSREAGYNSVGRGWKGAGRFRGGSERAGHGSAVAVAVGTSKKLAGLRKRHGALTFESVEPKVVIENEQVKGLVVTSHNAAEDIMKVSWWRQCGDGAASQGEKSLSIRRVVKTPERWDRICTLRRSLA